MARFKTKGRRELTRARKRAGLGNIQTAVLPEHPRPKFRGDCKEGMRPCPYVGCRYHLYLTVLGAGGLQFQFGDDLDQLFVMKNTCALDAADKGGMELKEVAEHFNLTPYGLKLNESAALASLARERAVLESADEGPAMVYERGIETRDWRRRRVSIRHDVTEGFVLDD